MTATAKSNASEKDSVNAMVTETPKGTLNVLARETWNVSVKVRDLLNASATVMD